MPAQPLAAVVNYSYRFPVRVLVAVVPLIAVPSSLVKNYPGDSRQQVVYRVLQKSRRHCLRDCSGSCLQSSRESGRILLLSDPGEFLLGDHAPPSSCRKETPWSNGWALFVVPRSSSVQRCGREQRAMVQVWSLCVYCGVYVKGSACG